ncbi:hypothetical protein Taro_050698, partial [Colocasia esculenta]|nr:hypothetical protein [Colocasia esculenta]
MEIVFPGLLLTFSIMNIHRISSQFVLSIMKNTSCTLHPPMNFTKDISIPNLQRLLDSLKLLAEDKERRTLDIKTPSGLNNRNKGCMLRPHSKEPERLRASCNSFLSEDRFLLKLLEETIMLEKAVKSIV